MKKGFLFVLFLVTCANVFSQELPHSICKNCWNPDSLGNHRVAIRVTSSGKYAKALIPWRRRDRNPGDKRIIIEDAETKQKLLNVKQVRLTVSPGKSILSRLQEPVFIMFIICLAKMKAALIIQKEFI